MHMFEDEYTNLISDIIVCGERIKGRNGYVRKLFGKTLTIDMSDGNTFPLLHTRKIYHKGILGEFAAFVRGPKHIDDFKRWGCNYWDNWAKPDGSIEVDYGNSWLANSQLERLIRTLQTNPHDRRLLISGWRPDRLSELDLPCCHLLYQWFVRQEQYLDMIWYQRSVDTMIGLPSDIVLAAIFNLLIANQVGLKPGRLTMILGDTHIYEEHLVNAEAYVNSLTPFYDRSYPTYELAAPKGMDIRMFEPSMLQIEDYNPKQTMKFEIKV
jgi:thymidylate synthase